ncbi:MAG TPA: RNA polymerase sigma-70 factor [Puia sp.]|nr:RNA polymerase sigma-70 factor [Puia sp.]
MSHYRKYTDKQLLALLSQNDEAAFSAIYDRFWQRLFVIAYNRVKDTPAAEDIVHDVFASLWANRASIDVEALENYLAVAVKYTVLTKLKKQAREKAFVQSSTDTPVIALPAEDAVQARQLRELIHSEIERLPEKCRLIFKYSREKGMPVKDIAHQLHLSPKTIENQLAKAVRHLRVAVRSFLQVLF